MKKDPAKKSKKGFTLIELVVVIAILGILAAILIPVIGGFISRANIAKNQANAKSLFNAIAMFLATDSATTTLTNAALPDEIIKGVQPLFGPIESDGEAKATIKNGVVESVTYYGVTYFRNATASGFS